MKRLEKFEAYAYALLRIVAGFLFMFHGIQKIFGLLTEYPLPMWSQLWIGGLIELLAGLALVIGLQARVAAFVSSGMMAVAYFQYHWKFQFGSAFLPIVNKGELAVLYCFLFLFIACRGAGKWSLDRDPGRSFTA
jgi:putative oxidoreductase